jgi:hypothetical protein
MDLDGLDGVSLNTPMQIEFSEFVLPETIRHDTIQVRLGPRYGIQAFGDFKVSGNIVTFYPPCPPRRTCRTRASGPCPSTRSPSSAARR